MHYGIKPWQVEELTPAELAVFAKHLKGLRRDGN